MLVQLDEVERRLSGRDTCLSGTIRLTTTESLLTFVVPALRVLQQHHSGLVIEVETANAFLTLIRRDADVALRSANAVPEGLVAQRLCTLATALYAAPSYLQAVGDIDPLDMAWLGHSDSLTHLNAASWMARKVSSERIVYRANSITALKEAAKAGLGVAPLPCFVASAEPGLRQVAPPVDDRATSLWLLTHPDLRRTPRVRLLLDAIAAHAAEHRALLEFAVA